MRKLDQKGLAPLLIILVLVLLGLVGFWVWYISGEKKANTSSQNQQQNTDQPKNEKSSAVKYLEIPEMSIKIELSDKLEGLYYAMHTEGWAYLSTTALAAQYSDCAANAQTGPAVVSFAKVGDDNFGEPYTEAQLAAKGTKIGDKYYFIDQAQDACSGVDSAGDVPQSLTDFWTAARAANIVAL